MAVTKGIFGQPNARLKALGYAFVWLFAVNKSQFNGGAVASRYNTLINILLSCRGHALPGTELYVHL